MRIKYTLLFCLCVGFVFPDYVIASSQGDVRSKHSDQLFSQVLADIRRQQYESIESYLDNLSDSSRLKSEEEFSKKQMQDLLVEVVKLSFADESAFQVLVKALLLLSESRKFVSDESLMLELFMMRMACKAECTPGKLADRLQSAVLQHAAPGGFDSLTSSLFLLSEISATLMMDTRLAAYFEARFVETVEYHPERPDGSLPIILKRQSRNLLEQRDYVAAERSLRKYLKLLDEGGSAGYDDYRYPVSKLAYIRAELGDFEEAVGLYERYLDMAANANMAPEKSVMAHASYAYWATGDLDKAEQWIRYSHDITEPEMFPITRPMAAIAFSRGDYDKAAYIVNQLLKSEGTRGRNYDLNMLAVIEAARNPRRSLELFVEAQTGYNLELREFFSRVRSEKQLLAYLSTVSWGYDGLLNLVYSKMRTNPYAIRKAFEVVLSRKGIVFDAHANLKSRLDAGKTEDLLAMRRQFNELQQQMKDLLQARLKPESRLAFELHRKMLQLFRKIEDLGTTENLAQESKDVRLDELLLQLEQNQALVEIVKVRKYDWKGKRLWLPDSFYLAFVLTGDGRLNMVDLGAASELDSIVNSSLASIGNVGSAYSVQMQASRKLYEALWRPLQSHLTGVDTAIISPDGQLNLVPFHALMDASGNFLVENMLLGYVTSSRDMIKGRSNNQAELGLYLVADPDFDASLPPSEAVMSDTLSRAPGFNLRFSRLPGTAKEAQTIPRYLKGTKAVLTGSNATESSIAKAGQARVIHFATHGFFLQDKPLLPVLGMRGAEAMSDEEGVAGARLSNRPANPMLRSGLALAGANHAGQQPGNHDGLLTALEVSVLDLRSADLVVLSACETARGDVKTGDGVYGLRRAFALAGSMNLVMSLWPVADEMTAFQMEHFFKQYGHGSLPVHALRSAQLETIRVLRQDKGYASPALWAPFIVQTHGMISQRH